MDCIVHSPRSADFHRANQDRFSLTYELVKLVFSDEQDVFLWVHNLTLGFASAWETCEITEKGFWDRDACNQCQSALRNSYSVPATAAPPSRSVTIGSKHSRRGTARQMPLDHELARQLADRGSSPRSACGSAGPPPVLPKAAIRLLQIVLQATGAVEAGSPWSGFPRARTEPARP